jgi:hypothetical protein
MMTIINIMPMEWDYVSELLLPTGLLFIPRVIYEYWEPWYIDVDRGKVLIRPASSVAILPAVI